MTQSPTTQPVITLGDPRRAAGPFVFCCEHGGNELPGVRPSAGDRALIDDHWGWDPGAAAVVEGLARSLDGVAVVARFSRLLIDPNRPLDSPTLIVEGCAGRPVSFNQDLNAAERGRRAETLHGAFHEQLGAALSARLERGPARLISVHSFTPVWRGVARPMEVGVLFDRHRDEATRLAAALRVEGLEVALNAPYSGLDGLIYAANRHGAAAGVPYLEIELRQDLLRTPEGVARLTGALARSLTALSARGL